MIWYKEANIEKHIVDAAFVYQIQNDELDISYLNKRIKELHLKTLFEELKKINIEQYI
jgi:hypothetical protein